MRILAFHLLNDRSGSPQVMHTVVGELRRRGHDVTVVTSQGEGFLRPDVCLSYHFRKGLRGACAYLFSQLRSAWLALRIGRRYDAVWVNTLLPVGAALGARMARRPVVYHYHEDARTKGRTYRLLERLMRLLASQIVCVSDYQRSLLPADVAATVIPNALPPEFAQKLFPRPSEARLRRTVLMISSMKAYKGVYDFVRLSQMMPDVRFCLVLNARTEEIDIEPTENLALWPRQTDVSRFYNEASAVVSLTHEAEFVETFGLTALEAMATALPVVVPTKGGIAELVSEGQEGWHISHTDLELMATRLRTLLDDEALYARMSAAAQHTAQRFSVEEQGAQVEKTILRYAKN